MPSKKVLSVFILTAALVIAVIVAFGRDKSSSAINYASNLVAGEKVSIPENPNWENELSGLGRNIKPIQAEEAAGEKTTTDTVAEAFMANYLALKQSGKLNNTSAQKLIDQTVDYVDQIGGEAVKITQLNIVADNGQPSIREYGENLGNIARNKKMAEIEREINLLMQIVQSGDSSKLNELNSIFASYEKIVTELIKMPVPKTFVMAHLDIVNGTTGMARAFLEMKGVLGDPLRGLAALQLYQKGIVTLSKATEATIAFIKQNGIIYEQGSGGYYLLYEL